MDDLKRATCRNYTAWDLNCRKYVNMTKAKRELCRIFRRSARRKLNRQASEEQI